MNQTKKQSIKNIHTYNETFNNPWLLLFYPFVILCLAIIFYYPSLHYSFQFDDVASIQKFFNIRFNTFSTLFFINPRWLSYWLNTINYSIGQFDPFIYRFFNLCFHTTTAVILFFAIYLALSLKERIVSSWFGAHRIVIAFTTATLFLLHPVQTQTVSYVIQGQLEGLACLFITSIIVLFLAMHYIQNIVLKHLFTLLLFIVAFFSCGTKEIAIISPLLVLLVDWFFVAHGNFREIKKRIWLHSLLLMLVWGMYLYLLKPNFFKDFFCLNITAHNNIGNVLTEDPLAPIKPLHFFISQFKVVLHYIVMFFWPFNISVEYDWKLSTNFFAVDCFLPFLILSALAIVLFLLLKKDKIAPIGFGALWFVISIAPRSSVIPSSELLADYKTYVASIGILFIIALALIVCVQKIVFACIQHQLTILTNRRIAFINTCTIILLIMPCGFFTYQRNKVWRSAEEFWANIIENAPEKARAYNNLAVALSEKGEIPQAIPLYKKAIAMDKMYPDPWNNLAVAYSMLGKIDLAIGTMQQALRIHAYYPEGYNNLASFLITKKDFKTAKKVLAHALQLRPYYGKAYFNLGKLYLDKGKPERAFEAFKAACLKADMDNEPGFGVYGNISMQLGKYEDAIFAFKKLYESYPQKIEYAINVANAYFLNQQYKEAAQFLTIVTQNKPEDAKWWYNLGESYFNINQFDQALGAFQKAKNLHSLIANLDLKIATTLLQLGRKEEACNVLTAFIKSSTIPEHVKEASNLLLAQL